MEVTVTEADIKAGSRCASTDCPLALALGRVFPDAGFVSVFSETFSVTYVAPHEYRWAQYELPVVATTFIAKFDQRKPVSPFTFVLPKEPSACLSR